MRCKSICLGVGLAAMLCYLGVADPLAADDLKTRWAPLPLMSGQDGLTPSASVLLANGAGEDRLRAAFILGQIGTPAAVAALQAAADDDNRIVRIHVGVALAQSGLPTSAACEAALAEGPAWLQFYAVHGLSRIGSPEAARVLSKASARGDVFLNATLAAAAIDPAPETSGPIGTETLVAIGAEDLLTVAANALVSEADLWFHVGEYDQCIRCNEAAVFLQPWRTDLYGVTGWLQWSMNRHGAAITTYRRAIAANPDDWEAHFELGFYYMRHGQLRSAVRYLRNSYELGAMPVRARSYAHALEKAGRLDESLEVWEALAEVDDSAVVTENTARVRRKIEQAAGSR